MSKEISKFVPLHVRSEFNQLQLETKLALLGVSSKLHEVKMAPQLSEYDVRAYAESIEPGFVKTTLQEHVKKGCSLPGGSFELQYLTGPGSSFGNIDGYVFSDGYFGFLLRYHKTSGEKLNLASTTFSPINKLPRGSQKGIDSSSLLQNSILIQQLQVFCYNRNMRTGKLTSPKGVEANDMLNSFRWEHFLVDIVSDFAHEMDIEAVYMQPAEKNKYYNSQGEEFNARLKMRYDTTAQRMGFVKNKQGIYGLLLL